MNKFAMRARVTREYTSQGYSHQQSNWLCQCFDSGLDVSILQNKQLSAQQMHQIFIGLRHVKTSVSGRIKTQDIVQFASPNYSAAQMHELNLGLVQNINIKLFLDPTLSFMQMKQIRSWIQNYKTNKKKREITDERVRTIISLYLLQN